MTDDDFLPVGTELGKLRLLDVLIYYDGPQLFTCRSAEKTTFLAIALNDRSRDVQSWIYAPIKPALLKKVLDGAIAFRDAFVNADGGFVFAVTTSSDADTASRRSCASLTDAQLPAPGVMLHSPKGAARAMQSEASESRKATTTAPRGGDLFIVDNSVSGWTGLRYLQDWTGIAIRFDIATGYFEIGALLELDGKWQQLEKLRILMGDEVSHRTRNALLAAIRSRVTANLDASIEADKDANPFLTGAAAIEQALRTRQIECRVYDKDKFHAKAYITHAKLDVVGAQALVGSSNFTRPGLTQNIELNIQVQSGREVAQLQEWYETHWAEAKDVTEDILAVVVRHTREYAPFDVYAKALQEFFRGHELTATEWDENKSRLFPMLDRYQKEAYWALLKIGHQFGGAFLCDGVGLGKTFVGLMLIERLVLHEGKRVVLLAPKAAKDAVWDPHIREFLPHIGGVGGAVDFTGLVVLSQTDLNRKGDFPERFRRLAEQADVVIVDEAHHFRNPGRRGDADDGGERSRYWRLFDLLDGARRPKTLYMLTATPINNELHDFRHMAELFTRGDEAYFARTLGVNNLRAHFIGMDRALRKSIGSPTADVADHVSEAQELLSADAIFGKLVVQRSRAYAVASQIRETGKAAMFPKREDPQVAAYSIRKTYGRLLDLFEKAFQRKHPLFTLAIYYPLAWYRGADKAIDPLEEGRQKQVVGLIRTQFLKRFESSVCAFELSCERLMKKLLAFLEVHSETDAEKGRLERWKDQHSAMLGTATKRQLEFWGQPAEEDDDADEDVVPQELLDAVERLKREDYNVVEMMQETFLDLDHIAKFVEELREFEPKHDDKLQKLIRLLRSKDLAGQKVLVFTEFADTARYVHRQLERAGIDGVAQVDSGTKGNRADVIRRFSPYYNRSSSGQLAEKGLAEIRVLISTDVLSEGLNLQDATRLINYDIHWNPVRLMQRIGRVDRRMSPDVEARMVADHPETKASRGHVSFWNFLPPDDLNRVLTLYKRVTDKTLLISKTLGIEGRKLLTPEDEFDALREFVHAYEGATSTVERMHLDYQELLDADPTLEARLRALPNSVFSGRETPSGGVQGVFFCFALPALDHEKGEFTDEAGTTRWYLCDFERDAILDDPQAIVASIRSTPETPRRCSTPQPTLGELRARVLKHIKNTYLKRVDAPVGVKPSLKCWMELNGG
jgi:superfamily II DNA or RNA helicase